MDLVAPAIARYAVDHTTTLDPDLARVSAITRDRTEHPGMMSGRVEARLLQALIHASGTTRVLEVGTFTGFGALAMARALPPEGRVTTLEVDPANAALARENIAADPFGARVELREGDAQATLRDLEPGFGVAYVDAWKNDYPAYFELVLPLLAPGGTMVFDNALRSGRVLEDGNETAAFNAQVQADPRVLSALLTVGDGVLLVWPAALL